jgi:hypothetical protein
VGITRSTRHVTRENAAISLCPGGTADNYTKDPRMPDRMCIHTHTHTHVCNCLDIHYGDSTASLGLPPLLFSPTYIVKLLRENAKFLRDSGKLLRENWGLQSILQVLACRIPLRYLDLNVPRSLELLFFASAILSHCCGLRWWHNCCCVNRSAK